MHVSAPAAREACGDDRAAAAAAAVPPAAPQLLCAHLVAEHGGLVVVVTRGARHLGHARHGALLLLAGRAPVATAVRWCSSCMAWCWRVRAESGGSRCLMSTRGATPTSCVGAQSSVFLQAMVCR